MALVENTTAQGPSPSYRVVIDSAFLGGMEIHTAQWTRVLAAAGHAVTLLQTNQDMLSPLLEGSQVKVVHHPIPPHLGKAGEFRAWRDLLGQYPADITVYARNGYAVVVLLALGWCSKKLITIDHAISGSMGQFNPNWQRPGRVKAWLSRQAIDHSLAVSQAVRQSAIDTWKADASRITVCHNWVDTQRHQPDAAVRASHRAAQGIADDEFVVGYLGRLSADKRIDQLVHAFARFIQSSPRSARLVIVGRGSHQSEIIKAIETHQLGEKVSLIDWTDDPASWHRSFDVEVNLTLNEAFGLSAVEAMANGCVLLAQAGSGVDDYLQHETYGFNTDLPDPPAIAHWLSTIAALPDAQLHAIRQAARQTAVTRFSPQVALANLLEHLGSPAGAALARTHGLSLSSPTRT